jgi:hypothetical protein
MSHFKVSSNSYYKNLAQEFIKSGVYSVHINGESRGSNMRRKQCSKVNIGDIFHIIDRRINCYWTGTVTSKFVEATELTTFFSRTNIESLRIKCKTNPNTSCDCWYPNEKCISSQHPHPTGGSIWKTELVCDVSWKPGHLTPEIKEQLDRGYNAVTIKPVSIIEDEVEGEIIVWKGT